MDTAAGYRASVQAQMNLDGNTLIKQLLNGQYSQSLDTVKTNPSGIIIFVISFLIGLILIIVLWPFLCCCCCCPSCCPSRCCQKPEDEQYTKCELYWPAITLILALLLAIAASAYGFTTAAGLGKGTRDLSCSTSMLIDDILNGNVTTDGKSFFVGMNQLLAQIGVINNQMGTINTQMKKLGVNDVTSQMKSYLQHGTDAKNAIDLIPTGVAGGSLSFTYGTPLNAIPTTGTITSNFGTVLGSTSSGGSGIVGALFNAVESGKGVLNAIATAADGFVASSGSFTSSVSQVTSTINDFKTTLTSGDNQIGGYFSST